MSDVFKAAFLRSRGWYTTSFDGFKDFPWCLDKPGVPLFLRLEEAWRRELRG